MDGPDWRAEEHEVARWCRLVGQTLGGGPDPDELDLAPPPAAALPSGVTVLHPGAAAAARRWPAERFAHVAAALERRGHDVVVTGGRQEVELAARVVSLARLSSRALLAGRTDLAALAFLVARAELVVSGDTGVAHLASAYRRPSVVLCGPVPPRLWGPPQRARHVALWHGGSGDPHAAVPDPALLEITAEEVIAAVERVLSSTHLQREAVP